MAKGFKVLISRIISSFQFCLSKSPSNFLENHVPSFLQLFPNPVFIDCPLATPPPFKPHHSSFKHRMSSIFSSVGSVFGTQYISEDDLTESPEFKISRCGISFHLNYGDSVRSSLEVYCVSNPQRTNEKMEDTWCLKEEQWGLKGVGIANGQSMTTGFGESWRNEGTRFSGKFEGFLERQN